METNQGAEGSVESARLEALLDKLVAVQLDLEPARRASGAADDAASNAIAETRRVLHSAIADLRNIIGQVDGMTDPPGSLPASE
jgi:hypothetical protein